MESICHRPWPRSEIWHVERIILVSGVVADVDIGRGVVEVDGEEREDGVAALVAGGCPLGELATKLALGILHAFHSLGLQTLCRREREEVALQKLAREGRVVLDDGGNLRYLRQRADP